MTYIYEITHKDTGKEKPTCVGLYDTLELASLALDVYYHDSVDDIRKKDNYRLSYESGVSFRITNRITETYEEMIITDRKLIDSEDDIERMQKTVYIART